MVPAAAILNVHFKPNFSMVGTVKKVKRMKDMRKIVTPILTTMSCTSYTSPTILEMAEKLIISTALDMRRKQY